MPAIGGRRWQRGYRQNVLNARIGAIRSGTSKPSSASVRVTVLLDGLAEDYDLHNRARPTRWGPYQGLEGVLKAALGTRRFHRDGKKIWEFRKLWTTAARQAGLEGLTPHDLCRSVIRNLRLANVDAPVAKKISGHVTDSVLQRCNIVTTGDVAEALRRVSKYLKAAALTAKTQRTEPPAKGD